jgi:16S rRNA processing protein RimM
VLDAWGVKGWFKLTPHSASPEALFSARTWFLLPSERGVPKFSGPLVLQIGQVKAHGDAIVATTPEVPDRNAAEQLKGARIFVSRAEFPPPEEGEYYWVDLMGLSVVNREGVLLGEVADLMAAGPQTTLVVQQTEGDKVHERLIPFVDAFVDAVDLPARRITVDWQPDY